MELTELRDVDEPANVGLLKDLPLLGGEAARRVELLGRGGRPVPRLVVLLARQGGMAVLGGGVCASQPGDGGRVLLPLPLEGAARGRRLVEDAIVHIGARLVEGLGPALGRGLRGGDDALGSGELDGGLGGTGVEVHGVLKGGGQVVGARRGSLLARAALGRAGGLDEAVALARGGRAGGRDLPLLAGGEEVGHEAGHGDGIVAVLGLGGLHGRGALGRQDQWRSPRVGFSSGTGCSGQVDWTRETRAGPECCSRCSHAGGTRSERGRIDESGLGGGGVKTASEDVTMQVLASRDKLNDGGTQDRWINKGPVAIRESWRVVLCAGTVRVYS